MTTHRFFVPFGSITDRLVTVSGDDARQIRRVLRLRSGDGIEVFDGTGRQVKARIIAVNEMEVTAQPVEITYPQTEAPNAVTLAQALLKGERMDWVVGKATELGASSILLFPAKRSVVLWRDDRDDRKLLRWRRIAKEAAEQCGRVKVPPVTTADSLRGAGELVGEQRWLCADEAVARTEGGSHEEHIDRFDGPTTLFIGPEGGWDPEEREMLLSRGAKAVSLGRRILRSETAALAALVRWVR